HSQPAGAVEIVLAVPVPVKLDFDAAELVRKDLFAGRADDHGRLGPLHDRAGRQPEGPERQRHGNARESIAVAKLPGPSREELAAPEREGPAGSRREMADGGDDVLPVAVEVPGQRELVAGDHLPAAARAGYGETGKSVLLHPDLDRALIVLEDLLQLRRLVASS